MAAAKKKTPARSRTSASTAKKGGFHFRWWMALILVAIVAITGIAVLRYSRASWNPFTSEKTQLRSAFNECDRAQASAGNPNWGTRSFNPGNMQPSNARDKCTRYIQTFLNVVGGNNISVDGNPGPITQTALTIYKVKINNFFESKRNIVEQPNNRHPWLAFFGRLNLVPLDVGTPWVDAETWNWINRITYVNLL